MKQPDVTQSVIVDSIDHQIRQVCAENHKLNYRAKRLEDVQKSQSELIHNYKSYSYAQTEEITGLRWQLELASNENNVLRAQVAWHEQAYEHGRANSIGFVSYLEERLRGAEQGGYDWECYAAKLSEESKDLLTRVAKLTQESLDQKEALRKEALAVARLKEDLVSKAEEKSRSDAGLREAESKLAETNERSVKLLAARDDLSRLLRDDIQRLRKKNKQTKGDLEDAEAIIDSYRERLEEAELKIQENKRLRETLQKTVEEEQLLQSTLASSREEKAELQRRIERHKTESDQQTRTIAAICRQNNKFRAEERKSGQAQMIRRQEKDVRRLQLYLRNSDHNTAHWRMTIDRAIARAWTAELVVRERDILIRSWKGCVLAYNINDFHNVRLGKLVAGINVVEAALKVLGRATSPPKARAAAIVVAALLETSEEMAETAATDAKQREEELKGLTEQVRVIIGPSIDTTRLVDVGTDCHRLLRKLKARMEKERRILQLRERPETGLGFLCLLYIAWKVFVKFFSRS